MICSLEVDAKPSHVLTLSLRCRIDVSVSLLLALRTNIVSNGSVDQCILVTIC